MQKHCLAGGAVLLLVLGLTPAALAHPVTYLGTVLAVEATRVQVRTVDEMTKKAATVWFVVDRATKIKRGETIVSAADAKMMKGERIAVTVDTAAPTKTRAVEIRLAEMHTAMAVMRGAPPSTGMTGMPGMSGQGAPGAGMPADHQHERGQQPMPGMNRGMDMKSPGWHIMQDGVVTGLFNHQGGPRGGDEFVVPNWWMGIATRERGANQFGLNAMLSLDPATVGKSGYREIFQVGEALDGKPLIDRQHPHDLFMQLSGSWRRTFSDDTALIIAGGPVGEPTLGPVAFMHRASAAGVPLAPLGHHTFDSTHISFGVVTAAVERGRWTFEGSAFNGREPDQDRWDFDFGAMDSVAGRVWFRPTPEWAVQVSTGLLREPGLSRPSASAQPAGVSCGEGSKAPWARNSRSMACRRC